MTREAPGVLLRIAVLTCLLCAAPPSGTAHAYVVDLAWRPIAAAAGYNIYLALDTMPFTVPLETGYIAPDENNEVKFRLRNMPLGPNLRIAISSYDAVGIEGPLSNVRVIDYAAAAPYSDSDGDGLTDAQEDRDLDGRVDAGETNRNDADTDGDGLSDGSELRDHGTNPLRADSDGDGISDGVEIWMGTDPRDRRSGNFGVCGNGLLEPDEECDQGYDNSNATPGACRMTCTLPDVCGDANYDRRITATDAMWIMQAATGAVADCPYSVCDANGNGSITVNDTMTVLNFAADADEPMDCSTPARIVLAEQRTYKRLEFTVDYAATGSTFVGEGVDVACEIPAGHERASAQIANITSSGVLVVELYFPDEVTGPADLLNCRFHSQQDKPTPDQFAIGITAVGPLSGRASATPAIDVEL